MKISRICEKKFEKNLNKVYKIPTNPTLFQPNIMESTGKKYISIEIKEREWNWIRHTLKIMKQMKKTLGWNPQGGVVRKRSQ